MRVNQIWIVLILFFVSEQAVSDTFRDVMDNRVEYIYSKIEVPDLPDTGLYRLGITIDKNIMTDPNLATRVSGQLGGGGWTRDGQPWVGANFQFNLSYTVPKPDLFAWFRKRPKIIHKGYVRISIVNADSPKSAFKFLVSRSSMSNAPAEMFISDFARQNRVKDIGTVGYNIGGGGVQFVRDNIAVSIVCRGQFKSQALAIARQIDARLLQQPLLTMEQLKQRCPKVSLRHKRLTGVPAYRADEIFCDVSLPKSCKYVIKNAMVNESSVTFKNGKASYNDKKQDSTIPLKLKATVITDELLMTNATQNIDRDN